MQTYKRVTGATNTRQIWQCSWCKSINIPINQHMILFPIIVIETICKGAINTVKQLIQITRSNTKYYTQKICHSTILW